MASTLSSPAAVKRRSSLAPPTGSPPSPLSATPRSSPPSLNNTSKSNSSKLRLRPTTLIIAAMFICGMLLLTSLHLVNMVPTNPDADADAVAPAAKRELSDPAFKSQARHESQSGKQTHSRRMTMESSVPTRKQGYNDDENQLQTFLKTQSKPRASRMVRGAGEQRTNKWIQQTVGRGNQVESNRLKTKNISPKASPEAVPAKLPKKGRKKKFRPVVPLYKVNEYQFTLWFDSEGGYTREDLDERTDNSLAIAVGERTSYKVQNLRYETCVPVQNDDDVPAAWEHHGSFDDVYYSSVHGFNSKKYSGGKAIACPTKSFSDDVSTEELLLLHREYAKFKLFDHLDASDPRAGKPIDNNLWGSYTRSEVVAFSYWSPSAQREVAVEMKNNGLRATTCKRDENCPRDCRPWAERQLQNVTSLFMEKSKALKAAVWDSRDGACKFEELVELVSPRRPFGGGCMCFTTCLTPESQDVQTTWPWKNQSQHEYFYGSQIKYSSDGIPDYSDVKLERIQNHRVQKFHHMNRPAEPNYVCPSKEGNKKENPVAKLDYFLHNDMEHHLFFIPEAKLIFCGIPKVGITEWLKFLRFTLGAGDYLSFPHHKQDRTQFSLSKLPLAKAEEILNDPTWTRAVFFRDPAERLLSAYLDKIVKEEYDRRHYKLGNFTLQETMPDGTTITRKTNKMPFETFVEMIASDLAPIEKRAKYDPQDTSFVPDIHGLGWTTDPHWRPQTMTCGMQNLLPKFDFIGSFSHMAEHSKMLLERTNLWETYGKHYTAGPPGVKLAQCAVQRVPSSDVFPREGFNQPRQTTDGSPAKHATGSRSKMDKYYTPELLEKVRKAYAWDYAIWDDISNRSVSDVPSGQDLLHVQEYCEATSPTTAMA